MSAGTSRICNSENRPQNNCRTFVDAPLRSVFTHRSPSGEFQPRFRLVNLYVTKFWRFRSTESIEKNLKRGSYLLSVMVFACSYGIYSCCRFQASTDGCSISFHDGDTDLDELRSLYDPTEEFAHPKTHTLDISTALNYTERCLPEI